MFPYPVLFICWCCYVCLLPALWFPFVCLLNTVIPATPTSPLFWIRANYHCLVNLPDTTGLSRREAIIRCLEIVYPRSRAKPTISSLRGAKDRTHWWWWAQAHREWWAIAVWGVTELRFTTEPELLVMSDQVREPATMPAAREKSRGQREHGEELCPLHHGC